VAMPRSSGRRQRDRLRRLLEHRVRGNAAGRPRGPETPSPQDHRLLTQLGEHATVSGRPTDKRRGDTAYAPPSRLSTTAARSAPSNWPGTRLKACPSASRFTHRVRPGHARAEATQISYGPVDDAAVDVKPSDAKVVDIGQLQRAGVQHNGTNGARRRAGGGRVPVTAPATLVGLPRVRLIGDAGRPSSSPTARVSGQSWS
jgi:hypothetical protein